MSTNKRQQQASTLRLFRKLHRFTGAALFIFFFIVAVTGTLLGWKKHSNGVLLAETQSGTTSDLSKWLPLDTLQQLAIGYAHMHIDKNVFVFAEGFWGIQVDGATGKLLSIERRRSDFVEKIHDGSILDEVFNTSNGQIKLIYTSIMGLALLIFTITGFWLWYGPKRMRKQ